MPKTTYICNECKAHFPRWHGQCSSCRAWNTIAEASLSIPPKNGYSGTTNEGIVNLTSININDSPRFSTTFKEFDRVLGGGVVPGSAILIGGEPGAGKSTLLLQVLCALADELPVIYVTGEESLQQVALRAHRLKLTTKNLMLLSETNIETICKIALEENPKILVIDSIQVMHTQSVTSAPGGISQVRESAALLTRFAKQNNISILMVGHVTKDGSLAGPKVLEHCIDCSIMFEGNTDTRFRTIRSHKNRFGSVNEIGVFAMAESGLKEVANPSAIFLSGTTSNPGSVIFSTWEGSRSLLVEIQALVDVTTNPNPKRLAVGLDANRLAMLIAILHKHAGISLSNQDIFVNVVGGVKITETSVDLALIFALISSLKGYVLPKNLIVFGEVGLSGEIRPVPNGQERLIEASKHGFLTAIVPKANATKDKIGNMKVIPTNHILKAIEVFKKP